MADNTSSTLKLVAKQEDCAWTCMATCGAPSQVVQIVDPRQSFRLIQQLGKQGKGGGKSTQLGEFYYPTGMCVDDLNTLMVCDTNNHRVQFFPQFFPQL